MIAIKARAHCKTRLANVLAPTERIALVRSMLDAVLAAARSRRLSSSTGNRGCYGRSTIRRARRVAARICKRPPAVGACS